MIQRLVLVLALCAGPALAQEDGFTWSLRGMATLDAGYVGQGKYPPGGEYNSGANLRRAQLNLSGDFGGGWSYSLGGVFVGRGSQTGSRANGYVEYQHPSTLGFRVGVFSAPSGMAGNTNAASELMLERPAPVTIGRSIAASPSRAALTGYSQGERHLLALSFTAGSIGGGGSYDDQKAVVGRAAWLAVSGEDLNWVVDAAFSHVFNLADTAGPDSGEVRFRDGPEISVDVTRTLDTGNIDARTVTTWNLESGATWRGLYLQGGYFQYHVRRIGPVPDPSFHGWYAQGSWILTGERRFYNAPTANFRPPEPVAPLGEGGFGAVELTARHSGVDLNFNPFAAPAAGGITGGRQLLWQAGVNWFPTAETRLSLVYDHIRVTHPEAPSRDFNADAVVMRAQFAM